jgi:predicted  nucleic acid-binding Zn-ribbon protein
MIFKCRNCGKTSTDIDMVLDGACSCGSTHFQLVSQDVTDVMENLSPKEELRKQLHRWLDVNIDSMTEEDMQNIRVSLESGNRSKIANP